MFSLGFECRSRLKYLIFIEFYWFWGSNGGRRGPWEGPWRLREALRHPRPIKSLDFLALLESASSPEPEPFLMQNWPSRPRGVAIVFFYCNTSRARMPVYMKMCSGSGEDANFGFAKRGAFDTHLTPKVPASKFLKVPKWDKRGLGCVSSGLTIIL